MGSPPRIAFFDIENSPSLGYFYEPYLKHGGSNIVHTARPWFMLSFAWKIRGESRVHCKALCDYPNYKKNLEDDSKLVKDLWELFDSCDILIAHNGKKFDVRKASARFLKHGLPPPSPFKVIDTLQIARSVAYLDSNRLGFVGDYLGYGGKVVTTGFPMHLRCIMGDMKAWPQMKRYNRRDVSLLAEIAERLMPWAKTPDLRPIAGRDAGCPQCLSHNVQRRGPDRTMRAVYQRMKCRDCGKWFRGEKMAA